MYTFYDLDIYTRKLCSLAVLSDEKIQDALSSYFDNLNEAEKECFRKFSKRFAAWAEMGTKKYKISKNAIKIAIRLKDELGVVCYPFIEKIATKGWSTNGGTFSWSMQRLDCGEVERDISSFEPTSMFVSKRYKLSVGSYNGFTVVGADEIH